MIGACCDWDLIVNGHQATPATSARTCDEHYNVEDVRARLAAHDALTDLRRRSVTIQAAYAFGDWPPAAPTVTPGLPSSHVVTQCWHGMAAHNRDGCFHCACRTPGLGYPTEAERDR